MPALDELLGVSPAVAALRAQVEQLLDRAQRAQRLPPLLLQGETGTGKGLLAGLIHRRGPRSAGPFIDVSCAAIPDGLLEAELFGFERGAFTDAHRAKPGLLRAAHRGTFFLDEVALLSDSLQAKLLKAVEERSVRRLGAMQAERIDVQLIAATNEDLAAAAGAGRFRSDLYHRLAVVTLTLPPLRERPDDVLLLVDHFLLRTCNDYGLQMPRRLTPDARVALQRYPWPGNVRELGNVIERAVLLAEGSAITAADLRLPSSASAELPDTHPDAEHGSFDERVGDLEREQLLRALNATGWNVSLAAIQLGISRNRLRYRIERHGLRATRDLQERAPRRRNVNGIPRAAREPPASAASVNWQSERRHLALLRADLVPQATCQPTSEPTRILAAMADKVRSFGGQVQDVSTSTMLAVFGLDPIENAPASAAFAALAVQKDAERARRADPHLPSVRIAIHAAQMSIARANAVSQVNLGENDLTLAALATLSALDQAPSILVSSAAAPFLHRRFELSREASIQHTAPTHYRLGRLESTGFGLGGPALAPFVGRQHELAVAYDRLAQAQRNRGQLVAIVGEPGVGKSRFVYELTRADRVPGWKVLSCRAFSYSVTTPALPVIELLKSFFQIDDMQAPSQIRETVTRNIVHRHSRLEEHLPALLALLDVALEDPRWQALDPRQRRQRTIEAVRHLLLQVSLGQPLLLIFEDLHWIDTETQGLLDALAESLPAERVLLLVTHRPEYQHRWGARTYFTQLRLDGLPVENTAELLTALLGADPGLGLLKQMLVKRGNPFFLEETLRTLVETGVLSGERGAYRLTGAVDALQVPDTVQAILATRVDRLSQAEKQLLHAAAVIGKDVPYALLAAITEQSEESIQRALTHLQEAEFLYATHLDAELKYTFKHALTREVTYVSLSPDRRKALHAQLVGIIERLHADRLSEQVERLAYHALRGESWEKAVRYSRQAATRALDRSAAREANAQFEQARVALQHLPEGRERIEQLVDLCFEQRNALLPLGEFARLGEVLNGAAARAEELGDKRRLGLALGHLAVLYSFLGEPTRAIESGEHARAIAEVVGDLTLRVVANYYLGWTYWFAGDPHRALEPARAVVALINTAPLGERFGLPGLPAAVARWLLAAVLAELGEFAEASAAGQEGLRIAQSASHPYSEALTRWGLGYSFLRQGDFAQAAHVLEPSLALCRAMEIRIAFPFVAASLGSAHLWSGCVTKAVPLVEEAVQAYSAMGILGFRSWISTFLAETYLVVGRVTEAQEQAKAVTQADQKRGWEAWAMKVLGDIHAHVALASDDSVVDQSAAKQAINAYRDALACATALGMGPLAAHCHFGLGKLNRRMRHLAQAREHFATAATLYREMDMRFWLEQVETSNREAF